MDLPSFRYHPDPLATGCVRASHIECVCCGIARPYTYTGPVHAIGEYDDCICPWCIADGSAHAKLAASFTDEEAIGGGVGWERVSQEIVQEVAHRTPGFCGWQQELWWTHCGDAAQFLGRAGRAELEAFGADAVDAVREDAGLSIGLEWDRFFAALSKDGSPTAYIFRCSRCGAFGGYQDCD
jgi:uncharacterized protein CbrC (UPF0167 family)